MRAAGHNTWPDYAKISNHRLHHASMSPSQITFRLPTDQLDIWPSIAKIRARCRAILAIGRRATQCAARLATQILVPLPWALSLAVASTALAHAHSTRNIQLSANLIGVIPIIKPSDSDHPGRATLRVIETNHKNVVASTSFGDCDEERFSDLLAHDNHGLFIRKDFNFDGLADLAVSDGCNGAYGSLSYDIFLADAHHPTQFRHSPQLSRLAHESDLALEM